MEKEYFCGEMKKYTANFLIVKYYKEPSGTKVQIKSAQTNKTYNFFAKNLSDAELKTGKYLGKLEKNLGSSYFVKLEFLCEK